jgi:hypothetical protein
MIVIDSLDGGAVIVEFRQGVRTGEGTRERNRDEEA